MSCLNGQYLLTVKHLKAFKNNDKILWGKTQLQKNVTSVAARLINNVKSFLNSEFGQSKWNQIDRPFQ